MKIAIMQPYFLPYIRYWSLISAVDKFVILDDVSFINRGWINRNRIMVQNKPFWITLPIVGASQNRKICDLDLLIDDGWKRRMLMTVEYSYKKCPGFEPVFPFLEGLLDFPQRNLSEFLKRQIINVCSLLEIRAEIISASSCFPRDQLSGGARIIDICRQLGARQYINLPGGSPSNFSSADIILSFIKPASEKTRIGSDTSVDTTYSILHSLMCKPKNVVMDLVNAYELDP